MFTVKATYRGEIRKLSFPNCTSFPDYEELCNQIYRVFPLSNDYYLSRLLFSPNASSHARILIATEVHSQEEYQSCQQQFLGRSYANALLRFSVYDETPHKTPSAFADSTFAPLTPISTANTTMEYAPSSGDNDKRPVIPPKPAGMFQNTPFEYISALSYKPSVSRDSRREGVSSTAMDVDSAASTEGATRPNRALPQPSSSSMSAKPCCSIARSKSEIQDLITSFQKDLDRALDTLGMPSPLVPTQVFATESSDSRCLECSQALGNEYFKCENCHNAVCLSCAHAGSTGYCFVAGSGAHNFKRISLPSSNFGPRQPAPWPAPPPRRFDHSELNTLFADGVFPSMGPARRRASRGTLNSASCSSSTRQCFNPANSSDTLVANVNSPEPSTAQAAAPVVHTGVVCDSCKEIVVGIRHKCLDCADFDLCTPCITTGAAERHDPFHEFFEISEPGRVIVHTVFAGDGERQTASAPAAPQSHNATCDFCDSTIVGDRYKCFNCPDFDTCAACFAITREQHPGHSFVKIKADEDYIRRGTYNHNDHFATCNSCSKIINGVRYKCMHPECPDFDLCDRCEAHPIPVHPESHPMLKMKSIDTVTPTVYRVGGTNLIRPDVQEEPEEEAIMSMMRCATPKPATPPPPPPFEHTTADEGRAREELQDNPWSPLAAATDPFLDPVEAATPVGVRSHSPVSFEGRDEPPVIAPIDGLSSLASSFEATVNANRIGLRTPSPAALSPFLERCISEAAHPSFTDDLLAKHRDLVERIREITQSDVAAVRGEEEEEPREEGAAVKEEQLKEEPKEEELKEEPKEERQEESKEEERKEEAAAQEEPRAESVVAIEEEDIPSLLSVARSLVGLETAAAPLLSATFISDVTVTDGQVFPPGAEFVKSWRMLNDSSRDWPEGTELVFVAGESLVIDEKTEVMKVGGVKAGEEVDVWTGELKAPDVPGRYVGYWRLRDEEGKVFGNSIWVEINVAEADVHSGDESSTMSASSMVMMPHSALSTVCAPASETVSGTCTIPSSTEDGNSDNLSDGSSVSLIDLVSSDDEDMAGWEDARSQTTADRAAAVAAVAARASPDYVLLFDDENEDDF